MIRGALLHDYFLYDWHEKSDDHRLHGFTHPARALKNAEEIFDLSVVEKDIIKRHMFPLTPVPPAYRESYLVCLADKICSSYESNSQRPCGLASLSSAITGGKGEVTQEKNCTQCISREKSEKGNCCK